MQQIKIGQIYRHYKGNHYEVKLLGKHSETCDELVGYRRREDGYVYFRPKSMFFDLIEFEGKQMTRFALVSESNVSRILVEAYGWYGAVGLLAGYALSSFDILSPDNIWYQIINITAALGIVTVSLYKRTYQPGVLNIVWAIVGIVAFVKILI